LGNGQTAVGDTVYAGYAFAGAYTVKMSYYDGQKLVTVERMVRITQDNMALVSDPVYDFLTGGVDAADGKTWVLDSLRTGHVRLWKRQTGQESNDRKAPLFYAGTGMYDDEITFKLLGAECIYENHGQSYSHGGTIDGIAFYRIEQLRQMGIVTSYAASPNGLIWYLTSRPVRLLQHSIHGYSSSEAPIRMAHWQTKEYSILII
jgi:hypothetical protein